VPAYLPQILFGLKQDSFGPFITHAILPASRFFARRMTMRA
jgi:hypothetical protein